MKIRLYRLVLIVMIIFSMLLSSSVAQASPVSPSAVYLLSGWFTIIWGDDLDGFATSQEFYLNTGDGNLINLILNEELIRPLGGFLGLDRQQITVEGTWVFPAGNDNEQPAFQVASISLPDQAVSNADISPAVTGSRPWVSIMCKFPDVADEPKDLAYFQEMYSTSWPGLDHYWRELSYNTINLLGSTAVGWYTLPQPLSYYRDPDPNIQLLINDCTGVADPYINFGNFTGINFMFNAEVVAPSATRWYMTLDGVSKIWGMTFLGPDYGYIRISIIEHEMGHAFGLPHSSGPYGATYDNPWDVMSDESEGCFVNPLALTITDCLGQHTIAYHKYLLGWIPAGQIFTPGVDGGTTSITLEQLALPQTSNYLTAQIPIGRSTTHFYTVEVRRKTGYDFKLFGEAVIIHEVDTTRDIPAHLIDSDNNGNPEDSGSMWTIGETFSDPVNGILIYVSSATTTGFQVLITSPSSVPSVAFNKASPSNKATDLPISMTLYWSSSIGVTSYEYCYETNNDNACSTWISTGTTASANLSGLNSFTTYYWQVRANNADGTTYADGSSTAYWSFITTDNYLQDPSFEAYIPNPYWSVSQYSTMNGAPLCLILYCGTSLTSHPLTGAGWGWFVPLQTQEGSLSQTVTFPSGSAKLRFYLWISCEFSCGGDTSNVFTVQIDGVIVFSTNATQQSSYSTYTPVIIDASAFANGTVHTVTFSSVSPGWLGFNLDDVALTENNLSTFHDVPKSYWAWQYIERLYAARITTGCSTNPLSYCPEQSVTRAQMAIFLERGLHGSAYQPPGVGAGTGFNDVATNYWAAAWIKQLAVEGITTGCGSGNYCPEDPVTRSQMAIFLLRSKYGAAYIPPGVGSSTGFNDVPVTQWAAAWIKQLAAESITTGCGSGNYCPEDSVTRAQMAVFLVRTFNLP